MPELDRVEIQRQDNVEEVYNIFIWKNGKLVFSGLTRNLEITEDRVEFENEDLAALIEDEIRAESIELSNIRSY